MINTWASYRETQDNLLKGRLILDDTSDRHRFELKVGDRKA